MPNISFAKTEKDLSEILTKIEDRLIVKKDSNTKGRIFYEWDNSTRLEISALELSYYSKATLNPTSGNTVNVAKSNVVTLADFNEDGSGSTQATDILMNSLIYDGTNIGIIIGENTSNITVFVIYKPTPLQWNDYFE